jgi:Pyridine nucleotide-disulphide oxidoreductase, dimerisation domain
MSAVIRAVETGETRGFMKAVVDADSGQILGCVILGGEGGEIMTIVEVAMLGKLTYTAMADAIFTHPLLAEGLNTLFAMFRRLVSEALRRCVIVRALLPSRGTPMQRCPGSRPSSDSASARPVPQRRRQRRRPAPLPPSGQ